MNLVIHRRESLLSDDDDEDMSNDDGKELSFNDILAYLSNFLVDDKYKNFRKDLKSLLKSIHNETYEYLNKKRRVGTGIHLRTLINDLKQHYRLRNLHQFESEPLNNSNNRSQMKDLNKRIFKNINHFIDMLSLMKYDKCYYYMNVLSNAMVIDDNIEKNLPNYFQSAIKPINEYDQNIKVQIDDLIDVLDNLTREPTNISQSKKDEYKNRITDIFDNIKRIENDFSLVRKNQSMDTNSDSEQTNNNNNEDKFLTTFLEGSDYDDNFDDLEKTFAD